MNGIFLSIQKKLKGFRESNLADQKVYQGMCLEDAADMRIPAFILSQGCDSEDYRVGEISTSPLPWALLIFDPSLGKLALQA